MLAYATKNGALAARGAEQSPFLGERKLREHGTLDAPGEDHSPDGWPAVNLT